MPHIHTQPNQHDFTVSSWIVLRETEDEEWRCLVHFHRKMQVLMQIGGHVELTETPWQTVANETREESGYALSELRILQSVADRIDAEVNVEHPVPFAVRTHDVGDGHYHTDLCHGFMAAGRPTRSPADGESSDLRWLTLSELEQAVKIGESLHDVYATYKFLLDHIDDYVQVDATSFSLEKPQESTVTYKVGRPGQ